MIRRITFPNEIKAQDIDVSVVDDSILIEVKHKEDDFSYYRREQFDVEDDEWLKNVVADFKDHVLSLYLGEIYDPMLKK